MPISPHTTAAARAEAQASRDRIILTGPSGWIGSAMLAYIADLYGPGWRDRVTAFGSSGRTHVAPDGTSIEVLPLEALRLARLDGAILIHLAYLTKEKAEMLGERIFTDTNLEIDDHILNALRGAMPKAVFVASSGAAALAADGRDRHPYGMCKLRQEDRFLAWGARVGVPVIAGRIFNLAGPFINKVESYAIGSFALQAVRSGEIRIEASVPVLRSFLHVYDLCALIIGAARSAIGRSEAIDLCGAEVVEMEDIAAAVRRHCSIETASISRPMIDAENPSVYLGSFASTKSLAMQLGQPLVAFEAQVIDTLVWLNLARAH